jgi:phage tail-like protein
MPARTGTSEMLLTTFNFAVEIDGVTVAYFKEASGLSEEVEVIEHKVVNEKGNQIIQKIAGHRQAGEITLKKSMEGDKYLSDWFKEVKDGKFDDYRRNGSIVLYDPQFEEIARWNFINGWPKSWSASDLDASADEIATEEIVITHEGLERV